MGERPLDELVQTASQQVAFVAREQVDLARKELIARAGQAGPGAAMIGGGALLGVLASGTGTAALILLLARRPGASAAALGVTGAYAGAGALLAREGLVRIRDAGPSLPDVEAQDEPAQDGEKDSGSAKGRTASAAKSARRTASAAKSPQRAKSAAKSAAKSPRKPASRPKPESKSKSTSPRRRASRAQASRKPSQAS